VPTLVISGQYDRLTPPGAGEALAAAIPGARHWLVPRAAHAPFLSHRDEFAREVDAFLSPSAAA
jgi:pimeloyl-[acyl-carrier protein] methyl ester esterase